MLCPQQIPITKERIQQMLQQSPRRCQLATEPGRKILHEPQYEGQDWSLRFPFCETFRNTFHAMCEVNSTGLREGNGNCYAYLKNVSETTLGEIRNWRDKIASYVVIRDCLALSFALDYGSRGGDPSEPRTEIGTLRSRAKPYNAAPTQGTYEAANALVERCLGFLTAIDCYNSATVVVAVPPSNPNKPFDLPTYMTAGIAQATEKPNFSSYVQTIRQRASIKEQPSTTAKLATVEGTIHVESAQFTGQTVLLIDDLYQSGVSMNYVALLLLEAGANKVFGLACEKTLRNDANIQANGRESG